MTPEHAETDALKMLTWLLADDEILPVFLGATGASAGDMAARATEPEFLASVVDFILMDDTYVLDCAAEQGWPPDRIVEIRGCLPGGDLPNWT